MRVPVVVGAATVVAGLALCLASPGGAATDPFYSSLQEEGRQALERRDFAAAERALKVAAFGLLEEPQSLASCLTMLALAQDGAAEPAPFRETVRRIAELETRFGAYGTATLVPETRKSFEAAVRRNLSPAAVAALPWIGSPESPPPPIPSSRKGRRSPPAKPGVAKVASAEPAPAPPADRAAVAPEVGGPAPPVPPQPTPEQTPEKPAPAGAGNPAQAPELVMAPSSAPPQPPLPAAELVRLRQAMQAARTVPEGKEVLRQAQALASAHPANPEVRRLVAESAYRASEWVIAAQEYAQIDFKPEGEPLTCYYASVCFFEVGKTAEAANLLRRCQDLLLRTPAVARNVERILGAQQAVPPRP
jgi:hypothetical protein